MNHLPGHADRIEHWPIERLRPYDRNPRTHSPAQVKKIAASMAEFGFTNPVLVDKSDGIIAGHGRLEGAKLLGLETVPVVVLDYLTDAQRRAYIIADNRLAEDAGWDEDLLAEELGDLRAEGFDLELTGFEADELDDLLVDLDDGPAATEPADEDDVPPVDQAPPVARPGDVWRLGSHRVMCGDSTSTEQIATLLAGQRAACLWTDPPYNVNYESKAGKIQNDHMADDDFAAFLRAMYTAAIAHMEEGAPAYIAHADGGPMGIAFRQEFIRAGFKLAACLVWRKNQFTLGRSDYHWQHEPILYGWKPGAAHRWYGARDKASVFELDSDVIKRTADGELQINLGETGIVIRGQDLTVRTVHGTVFLEEKPKRSAEHPTMKPVALIERMLTNSTRRGDVVLDLFGGSGSTLIACEKLRREARLMELDARFVDVIVRRWQEFTGRKARLDATGETFAEVATLRARGLVAQPAAPLPAAGGLMTAGRPFTEMPAANDGGSVRKRA